MATNFTFGAIEGVITIASLVFLFLGYFSYTFLFISLGEMLFLFFGAFNPLIIPVYFSGIIVVWGLFIFVGFIMDVIRSFAPKKYEIKFVVQNEQRNKIKKETDSDRYYI